MVTYKRIKKRNNTSGEAATTWEFFDQIDEVFGTRSSVQFPSEMLEYSLESLTSELLCDNPATPATPSEMKSEVSTPISTNPSRKRHCELLDFLSTESQKDDKTVKELLDLEKERLALDKEKITELKNLRLLLEKMVDNTSNM